MEELAAAVHARFVAPLAGSKLVVAAGTRNATQNSSALFAAR